jgi:hypothetical protein
VEMFGLAIGEFPSRAALYWVVLYSCSERLHGFTITTIDGEDDDGELYTL